MSIHEAARAAREHADGCINPGCHRLALALEGGVWTENREAKRILDDEPEISTEGCPPPPVSALLIERPPPPSGS